MKARQSVFDTLSSRDRKILDQEIQKRVSKELQVAYIKYDIENEVEFISAFLLSLIENENFGEKRLKRNVKGTRDVMRWIKNTYELPEHESGWIATQKLKEMGYDVAAWCKEFDWEDEENEKQAE